MIDPSGDLQDLFRDEDEPFDRPFSHRSNIYKGLGTLALTLGVGALAVRQFGPSLKSWAARTAERLPIQAKLAERVIRSNIDRGEYGRAARAGFDFLTAPIQQHIMPRAPEIVDDLAHTLELLREDINPDAISDILASWKSARAPTVPDGVLRPLTLRDVHGLRPAHPVFERRPYWRGSLGHGLARARATLGQLETQLTAAHFPQGAFEDILNVPVESGLFATPSGGVQDLRFFHPRHWGLNLWERFELPQAFNITLPGAVPLLGGMHLPFGGAKPFAWLSQLFAPVELMRRQPITRVLRGFGRQGGGADFLAAGGKLRPFSIVDRSQAGPNFLGPRLQFSVPLPSRRAMEARFPTAQFGFHIGGVSDEGVQLVQASSSVGKGVRIRTGQYEHSLDDWLQYRNISPNSITAKTLRTIDENPFFGGIGPHRTSPHLVEENNRIIRTSKKGALEHAYEWILNAAHGTFGVSSAGNPMALGEQVLPRYIPLKMDPEFAHVLGEGAAQNVAQGLSDFANFSTLRPLYLLEEGLGIGLKGGKTAFGSMWRIFTRLVLPAYMGLQGVRYLDYRIGKMLGIAPSDLILDTYAGSQVARATVSEKLGIRSAANRLEEVFPGSVSSPLSVGTRTLGGGLLGARLGGFATGLLARRFPFLGRGPARALLPIVAGVSNALLWGSDPRLSSEKLRRQYTGEELVGVRRSRYWELGKDSFFGRSIQYYRPHWLAMRRNRSWERSIYGSEDNYWAHGTLFPTQENLFGLVPLADPYWLEDVNERERPYPETGPLFGDVPIMGPALEATIGRKLKPVRRHPDLERVLAEDAKSWSGDPFTSANAADRLGIGSGGLPQQGEPGSRLGLLSPVGKQVRHLQDWSGLQGFLWSGVIESITGKKNPLAPDRELETSDRMAGMERWFYGLDVGGGFQTYPVPGSGLLATEFFRRFYPHRDRSIELVNPLPNAMPDWLPGSRSAFKTDRNFYVDFHKGDPYNKITQGDVRLPGRGYESVRPLHSGIPGVYDPVDRLLILEEIAPGSESAKHYRAIVSGWRKAGVIDDYWDRLLLDSALRIQEKKASKDFGVVNKFAEPGKLSMDVTIRDVTSANTFTTEQYPFGFRLAGASTNMKRLYQDELESGNAATLAQARENVRAKRQSLRSKLESLKGQKIRIHVSGDEASRFRAQRMEALIPGVSEDIRSMGLLDPDAQGLASYLRGGDDIRKAANVYYGLAASEPIDPVSGWLKNKLFPIRDPLEDYFRFEVIGNRFGAWETPVESFLAPWARQAVGTYFDFIPGAVEERRENHRRLEALRYVRDRKNLALADAVGDGELAQEFLEDSKRTYIGLNMKNPREAALFSKSALAPAEREYFRSIKNLRTTAERERALRLLPEEAQYIFTNLWRQEMPRGARFESENLSQAARRYDPGGYRQEELDAFLSTTDLPEKDWVGYDPRVAMNSTKVRWIESEGDNIHNYGLWESDRRKLDRYTPELPPPDLTTRVPDPARVQLNLRRLGLEVLRASGTPGRVILEQGERRERGYDASRKRFEKDRTFFPERL